MLVCITTTQKLQIIQPKLNGLDLHNLSNEVSRLPPHHLLLTGLPQDFFEHHSRLPSSYLVREKVVDEKGWQRFARCGSAIASIVPPHLRPECVVSSDSESLLKEG